MTITHEYDPGDPGSSPAWISYVFRCDRGGRDDRFQAVSDEAAREYVRDLLYDEGAEDGDGGGIYRIEDDARGVEEYVGDVHLGDDEQSTDECFTY